MGESIQQPRWAFWIDRGGTFTDIVARSPQGSIVVEKLLSEQPDLYPDAAAEGIRRILGLASGDPLPGHLIESVRMGTTVGTNALLEQKGAPTVLAITAGFGDALRIAYQNRPDIFALHIRAPGQLYEQVVEVRERVGFDGQVQVELDEERTFTDLRRLYDEGYRSVAIVFMHGYKHQDHERRVASIARRIGYEQVSTSHEVSPLIRLISRGDTAVVDAYLSPVLRRYVERLSSALNRADSKVELLFMQSSGGLIDADLFRGKDSILSGPAGGIVGAAKVSASAGFPRIIAFDMGGTSTDVSHFDGTFERVLESEIAGTRLRVPMLSIHTVAAGGGSILSFESGRFQVGPASAGAHPGPASYRRGGPLTVTDCNVLLGRIQPDFFPSVFGPEGNEPLDVDVVRRKFAALAEQVSAASGTTMRAEDVAEGFLRVAVENMADAIKAISVQRGRDLADYALCAFGGAGGQHACRVADRLGIRKILIHPLAGVLSAYGMGLAEPRIVRDQSVELALGESTLPEIHRVSDELVEGASKDLKAQGFSPDAFAVERSLRIRYSGADTTLIVPFTSDVEGLAEAFHRNHALQFGFDRRGTPLVVAVVSVEVIVRSGEAYHPVEQSRRELKPVSLAALHFEGRSCEVPVYSREGLSGGQTLQGPAIIADSTGTIVVDTGWRADVLPMGELVLVRAQHATSSSEDQARLDPVRLELFHRRFVSIAEEMGYTLQNTSHSVNIKERLDFSCALFDDSGDLVANAPHIPVHLGSMGESVRAIIAKFGDSIAPGDAFLLNSPYHGGTHLPDITVVTPVFHPVSPRPSFYVASRGHHADVGGLTPGSMPPQSRHIDEEGCLSEGMRIVESGQFNEDRVRQWLGSGQYPARNPEQNIADLHAQIAANRRGEQELLALSATYGVKIVGAYMKYVQDNAEEMVRQAIARLSSGRFTSLMDDGIPICIRVDVDHQRRTATIDFTGTAPQQAHNFNAPLAVTKAAVLYVFRTLVEADIPLNAGCLRPLTVIVPSGSLLNPKPPAAVVAGNVETSQYIVDALLGALGALAASQGTMNNLTFGNDRYQYYETICGGAGAGNGFAGADAVQTHMTNSRLTDPEVLESRYPVIVESFAVRRGSGGKGRFRGGNGVVRKIRFLETMQGSILSSHRIYAPFGLAGGGPGVTGRNTLLRSGRSEETLNGCAAFNALPGDVLVIETPGGGAYGGEEAFMKKE